MKNILIALLILSCSTACGDEDFYDTPPWDPTEHGYKLVWEDNFDGVEIDRTKWDYRAVGNTRHRAIVDSNTVYLDGKGNLVIELCERNGKFYVGQLTTQRKHLFKYGYFECNVYLNKQHGMHSAFWLQSPKVTMGEDTSIYGAEIDIFEYVANDPGGVYTTVHWDYQDLKSLGQRTYIPQVHNGYHTFGLEWTPERYTFYVDNRQIWQITRAISQIDQYIILSTEYNGWGGDADPKNLPDKVIFDYVKVYSKESYE